MSTINCNIDGRLHYNDGWSLDEGWLDINADKWGYIGYKDGESRLRSVYRVKIPKISGLQSGKKLTITIAVGRNTNSTAGSQAKFRGIVTDGEPYRGPANWRDFSIKGKTLGETVLEFAYWDDHPHGITFDISLNEDTNNEEHYVYLWVYSETSYAWQALPNTRYTYSAVLTYEGITPVVTNNIINATNGLYRPDGQITLQWNPATAGIDNNVSGYMVYIRYNAAPTASTYNGIDSTTSTSYTFSNLNASRGSAVWVGVQALGSRGDPYNGQLVVQRIGTINSLPNSPEIKQTGTVLGDSNVIQFEITKGYDIDGNALKNYYSLNGGSKIEVGSILSVTKQSFGNELQSNNSIVFYTSDSLGEYSVGSSPYTFTTSFAPELKNINISHTYVTSMNNNTNTLVKMSKISYSLIGEISSVRVYVKAADSSAGVDSAPKIEINNEAITTNFSSRFFTIDISKISTSYLPKGKYFSFVFDAISPKNVVSYNNAYSEQTHPRRPKNPQLPIFNSCNNDACSNGIITKPNYFKDAVIVSANLPANDNGCAKLAQIQIVNNINSDSVPCKLSNFSQKVDLTKINRGSSVSLSFRVIDEMGQSITGAVFTTLTRTTTLSRGSGFGQASFDKAGGLRPLSDTSDSKFTHAPIYSDGSNISYEYKLKITSETVIGKNQYTSTSTQNQLVEITIKPQNMTALAKSCANNLNKTYTNGATISFTAKDGFDQTYSEYIYFTIDFQEAPVISNNDFFIKHDYNINSTSTTEGYEVPIYRSGSWGESAGKIMFNSREGIIFSLPQVEDLNGVKDIVSYNIYYATQDFESVDSIKTDNNQLSKMSFTKWITIPYGNLIFNNGYSYYRISTPQITKNQCYYFKVQAVDSTGKTSIEKYCKSSVVVCRTVQPKFSVTGLSAENLSTGSLVYNINIQDLGGSAKSSGWDPAFYKNYPNFERQLPVLYKPTITLTTIVSDDINFQNNVVTNTTTYEKSFLEYSQKGENIKLSTLNSKVYIKFVLQISYGPNAYVVSEPQFFTYFYTVPTVAHRKNSVGINTKIIGDEDVLVVENFGDKKKIVLKGEFKGVAKAIEINLVEGAIDGAIINGGTW